MVNSDSALPGAGGFSTVREMLILLEVVIILWETPVSANVNLEPVGPLRERETPKFLLSPKLRNLTHRFLSQMESSAPRKHFFTTMPWTEFDSTTTITPPLTTMTAGPIQYPSDPPTTTPWLTSEPVVEDDLPIHFIDDCPDGWDFYNCTGFEANGNRDGLCFYFRQNNTLNCEGAKLSKLPKGIPTEAQTFLLSGNHIKSINQRTFAAFHSIVTLDLCYGWLHQVDVNTFTYMTSLEHLQLMQHHSILQVGSQAFYELPRLRFLRIGRIQEQTLSTVFFDLQNSQLQYLGLYYTKFNDIRKVTFDSLKLCPLTTLEILESSINSLDALAFSDIAGLHRISIVRTPIGSIDRDAFATLSALQHLNLTDCSLKELAPGTFDSLGALQVLNCKGNRLQSLHVSLFKYNKDLTHVDFSHNHLLTLPQGLFDSFSTSLHVNFSSNFFTCDCSIAWASSWIRNLDDLEARRTFRCHFPLSLQGNFLEDFQPICIPEYVWYILSGTLGILLLAGVAGMLYVNRWKIYYKWFIMLSKRKGRKVWMDHPGFSYDVFVAYSEHDFLWVLHELIPHLEDGVGPRRIRMCMPDRDWEPGSSLLDNVEDSIQCSRKTLCIISGHFLRSDWCRLELSMAHMQLFLESRDVLVFVFLEAIPPRRLSQHQRLRRELCKKSCLDWPANNPDAQRVFWEKLRSVLLRPLRRDIHVHAL